MGDAAASTLVQRALIRVPDLPHWVDTRGIVRALKNQKLRTGPERL